MPFRIAASDLPPLLHTVCLDVACTIGLTPDDENGTTVVQCALVGYGGQEVRLNFNHEELPYGDLWVKNTRDNGMNALDCDVAINCIHIDPVAKELARVTAQRASELLGICKTAPTHPIMADLAKLCADILDELKPDPVIGIQSTLSLGHADDMALEEDFEVEGSVVSESDWVDIRNQLLQMKDKLVEWEQDEQISNCSTGEEEEDDDDMMMQDANDI